MEWAPVWEPKEDRQENQLSRLNRSQPKPFTAEWALYKFLAEWTPDDLKAVVEKDMDVDLSAFAEFIVATAVEKVLEWFKAHRPDLAQVLESERGRAWLEKTVRKALAWTQR